MNTQLVVYIAFSIIVGIQANLAAEYELLESGGRVFTPFRPLASREAETPEDREIAARVTYQIAACYAGLAISGLMAFVYFMLRK